MTFHALTFAMLLTGAEQSPENVSPSVPVVLVAPVAVDQQVPATPVASDSPPSVEPPQPPLATDTVAPASTTEADRTDIVVTARVRAVPGDPLAEVNAASYEATQAVDRAFVRPVAMAYRNVVPEPIRSGVRNFLTNLTEPIVFLNFLLQLKPGKAAETAGRFAINTTIGAAGLFDIAKRRPFKLPYRLNGFANTLGYYGVKPGPFLFLPLVGPTTLRDVFGLGLDRLLVPTLVGKPFNSPTYTIPTGVLSSLDQRAQFDEKLERLHSNDVSRPYTATREDYLRTRQEAIDELQGKRPVKPE